MGIYRKLNESPTGGKYEKIRTDSIFIPVLGVNDALHTLYEQLRFTCEMNAIFGVIGFTVIFAFLSDPQPAMTSIVMMVASGSLLFTFLMLPKQIWDIAKAYRDYEIALTMKKYFKERTQKEIDRMLREM